MGMCANDRPLALSHPSHGLVEHAEGAGKCIHAIEGFLRKSGRSARKPKNACIGVEALNGDFDAVAPLGIKQVEVVEFGIDPVEQARSVARFRGEEAAPAPLGKPKPSRGPRERVAPAGVDLPAIA